MSMKLLRRGFTLMEVLIVVAIICLLSVIVLMNLRGQIARGNDAKRKMDLNTLSKFFEDYYNDHNVFPDQPDFNSYHCGSTDMAPYLTKIPCDPESKTHYGYFPSVNGGYRICAKLSDKTDPAIAAMNCGGAEGCGVGGGYNFCLASGVTASAVGTLDEIVGGGGTPTPTPVGAGEGTPTPTPTPTPTLIVPTPVACTKGGTCDSMPEPWLYCTVWWSGSCPTNLCATPANRCTK
jgi:prepilin-type N-terminal cleavage/methylation domain-containing protein